MKKSAANIFVFIFIALSILTTAGNNSTIFGITKSLLMPALMLFLFFSPITSQGKAIIIAGLIFSWMGDVLLLFESRHPLFFIGGLVSFLTTHIFYIIYFLKIRSPQTSLIRNQPWLAALVAAYGVSLVLFLSPHLGEMKLPVMLYAAVICTMVICSLHVFTKTNSPANILFVAGAVLFAASDSLLAVNKFYKPFASAGMLIILTYCAAQLLIVLGVTKRKV
ncbi:MAG: lysoplasmalogenase [Bacteroidota bacterium]